MAAATIKAWIFTSDDQVRLYYIGCTCVLLAHSRSDSCVKPFLVVCSIFLVKTAIATSNVTKLALVYVGA